MSLIAARVGRHLSMAKFKPVCSIGSTRLHLLPRFEDPDLESEREIDQRSLPTDYDPANPDRHGRKPPTDRVWSLVDEFTGLTLLEASDLSSIVMERFCAKMTARLSFKERYVIRLTRPPPEEEGESGGNRKAEPKSAFELRIESFEAASKLKVIKEIRNFTDLGLKEAKEAVEKVPFLLKKGVLKEEAERIVERMKAVGAVVVMV